MKTNKNVILADLGIADYQKTWDHQEALLKHTVAVKTENRSHPKNLKQTQNYLILCEHEPVYTLGKSGKLENLLIGEEERSTRGISFYKINRGGDITFHGPGQLVGYPIFDLSNFKEDIHWYLRTLEEAAIRTLAEYNIIASRIEGLTGVWLDKEGENPRKILAIGVRCSRWVSMHGFAFNINTNLDYFKHIIPCGIDDKAVTSMQNELGRELNMDEVKQRLLHHLGELFEFELQEAELPV